ncbi:MAG TPA: response regulator [Steroidobacteraceae bacterium]|nr:response regulator [Steroidobacteraceae bacterium]
MNHLAAPDAAALLAKRILLVEDDDGLYQALRDSLLDAGYEVFGSCERVCDPMDTVPASRLDVALVDMDPLGSGRAASLTQQLGERNIPIVWITARRDSSPARVSQTRPRLRKPFTERELLDSIACAVGTST